MNNNKLISLILLAALITGCGGGGSDDSTASPQPTPNLSVTISSSSIYEERSEIEISSNIQNGTGTIQYSWQQISGIDIPLSSTDQSKLAFNAPEVMQDEEVSFKLTITDGANQS